MYFEMNLMVKRVQTAKTVNTQVTTASGRLAALLTKPTQDLAKVNGNVLQVKQLLSTTKTATNPRGGLGQRPSHDTLLSLACRRSSIEMFDCIMEYIRQCNNVESMLKFGDLFGLCFFFLFFFVLCLLLLYSRLNCPLSFLCD